MKVNYPTNNKNTQMDFSDNFHNIKNFVQVDHIEKKMKIRLNSFFATLKKTAAVGKIFQSPKFNVYKYQIIV